MIILLTKIADAQIEVAFRYHRVRGLYFLAVIFAATIYGNPRDSLIVWVRVRSDCNWEINTLGNPGVTRLYGLYEFQHGSLILLK